LAGEDQTRQSRTEEKNRRRQGHGVAGVKHLLRNDIPFGIGVVSRGRPVKICAVVRDDRIPCIGMQPPEFDAVVILCLVKPDGDAVVSLGE
jgi:hypothetical protein